MNNELKVIVPSRGRPDNVLRLISAWTDTGATSGLEIVLDNDDTSFEEWHFEQIMEAGDWIGITSGPRIRLGPTLNREALIEADLHPFIGFMGDDHVPRTPGWDERICEALRELGTGIVYGNDLFQGPNLPTAVFMTSDIIKTLGYMCPPGLVHMYLDNAWLAWGQGIDRLRYLPDVVIEHVHPQAGGKAEVDEGYREVWPLMQVDEPQWLEYKAMKLEADLDKLRGLLL